MNVFMRIIRILTERASLAADALEDPVATLEAAYRAQLGTLDEARRSVVDVLAAEKRFEIEANALAAAVDRATSAAQEAVHRGDDARVRVALEREAFLSAQRDQLLAEAVEIRAQRETLQRMTDDLSRRVEILRTEKLTLEARLASAHATIRAGEHTVGISSSSNEVSRAVERARDRVRDVQARSAALGEIAAGISGLDQTPVLELRLAALKRNRLPAASSLERDAGVE